MLLDGKSIVVTGGNTGIGKAIILAAAAEGAKVVVDYILHPESTAKVIGAAERAGGCAADRSAPHRAGHAADADPRGGQDWSLSRVLTGERG
jgi:NAD(P)-dependent dehydrogenase (short-subunit alcohol dehydrogenase family)